MQAACGHSTPGQRSINILNSERHRRATPPVRSALKLADTPLEIIQQSRGGLFSRAQWFYNIVHGTF
jgi:hypothetical protein